MSPPAITPLFTHRAWSVLVAAGGLFIGLCVATYDPADIPLLSSAPHDPATNLGGALGAWVGFVTREGFGWAALIIPLACALWAWRLWNGIAPGAHGFSLALASICLVTSVGTLLALQGSSDVGKVQLGGLAGFLLAQSGAYYLGATGTVLAAICIGALSWLVVFGRAAGQGAARSGRSPIQSLRTHVTGWLSSLRPDRTRATAEIPPARRTTESEDAPTERPAAPRAEPLERVRIRSTAAPIPKSPPPSPPPKRQATDGFQLPSLDLLATPPPVGERQLAEDLQANARILEETLREFGVEARVENIDRGPTVTRYELMPAPGIKLTKIVSLADDIALVMKAASCHIVAPIPGKGRVGIDVPNSTVRMVYLKEILTAPEFARHPSPLALPIGKDVSGQAVVADLRECPHLLIAGATGSGKTVCLNSVLVGMLSHASPEQVRFLMVDPKMVELAMFNNIPQLIAPVVTNAKKASAALQWAVQEMERRYQLLAQVGARNIELYNATLSRKGAPPVKPPQPAGEEDAAPQPEGPLPYLVIVIDELADLMMVSSQDVENAITRLAQLSRAVGLHIILATQRPSVDVITGVIKANFPARIAFQVASKVDSRTILDMNGADKLLGRGDLLFLRPGTAKPIRVQGAYVTDGEIERVTTFLKQQQPPSFDERLMDQQRQPEGFAGTIGEKDELYELAKQLVLETGQASTSLLQRRLRLGYGRAARILDLMEQEGLVGPPQGSRPRDVLVAPNGERKTE